MEIKKKKKSSNILLDNQTQKIWCFLENLSRDGRLICDQFVANKSPKISAYVIMESLHARMYPVLFSLSLSLSLFFLVFAASTKNYVKEATSHEAWKY